MPQKTSSLPTRTVSVKRTVVAGGVAAFALGALALGQPGPFPPSSALAAPQGVAAEVLTTAPSFADVVEAVRPAVVSVRVSQTSSARGEAPRIPQFRDLPRDHPFNEFFRRFEGDPRFGDRRSERPRQRPRMGQGSGFIISEDGYVVTNNHVIDNASAITVTLDNGEVLDATLVGADERTDLALLKIEDDRVFKYVAFSDTEPRVGDWVVAMGNPFGLGGTVTAGIISARGRDIGAGPYDDFLQIDAPVNRGNSGGPAFALDGGVVGINTAIFSPNGGNVGIAFAIPAATAKRIVAELQETGSVTRGWLGVNIQPVTSDMADSLGLDDDRGAIVTNLTEDSPAEQAGLRVGDTILEVDGRAIENPKDLARKIAAIAPGEAADITVLRRGREREISVEIGELPGRDRLAAATPQPEDSETTETALTALGLTLARQESALVVTEVDPDSDAAQKGLRPGDRIEQVNGADVMSPGDVADEIATAEDEGKSAVLVLVRSGDRSRFVAIELQDA